MTNSIIFGYCVQNKCYSKLFSISKQGRKKKYYLLPKIGNFCRILKKSVGVRVSKSVKYCLNHKGFHPVIVLSKVGCFLLPSVYVAFSDILMPEELPQIHSGTPVLEFKELR